MRRTIRRINGSVGALPTASPHDATVSENAECPNIFAPNFTERFFGKFPIKT